MTHRGPQGPKQLCPACCGAGNRVMATIITDREPINLVVVCRKCNGAGLVRAPHVKVRPLSTLERYEVHHGDIL